MAYNILVLDLDITGRDVNNKIFDEPHSLTDKPTRSIAPNLGPFYANSLLVRDGARTLSRGLDYQIVELHQEATLRYGQEISSIILIINSAVSSEVTITYQALGGHFAYNDSALGNMYESVMTDNRPVDWSNVLNKDTEFTPTIHRHLLDDIYGFEPIVDHLERIKRAITLGQTTILLEVINSFLSKFECKELPKVLPSDRLIQYDALLYFLSKRKILSNIWIDVQDCEWIKGRSHYIEVDTGEYPVGTDLYWELYKPDSGFTLFTETKGKIKSTGGIMTFSLYTPAKFGATDYPLYMGIKLDPLQQEFSAVTYIIRTAEPVTTDSNYGRLLFGISDGNKLFKDLTMIDNNNETSLYHLLFNY